MRAQKEQGQQSPLMHKLTSAGRGLLGALHRKARASVSFQSQAMFVAFQ